MRDLLKQIFSEYKFLNKWQESSIEFYSAEDKEKTSFFLINYIDTTHKNVTDSSLLQMLRKLEVDYINERKNGKGVKNIIQELFKNDVNIAAQIDKNTSAIYPIKLETLSKLDKYRNLIYSVEESPYYFRRFILPYTEKQVTELNKIIFEYPKENIVDILSKIANREDEYYDLAGHRNLENAYELVIRLFSKIPFLQYNFVTEQKPMPIQRRIENEMSFELKDYHSLICNKCMDIDEYVKASTFLADEMTVEAELQKRLGRRG